MGETLSLEIEFEDPYRSHTVIDRIDVACTTRSEDSPPCCHRIYTCHAELFQTFIDRRILTSIAHKQTRNTSIYWEDAAQVASEKLWKATQQGSFRGDIEH